MKLTPIGLVAAFAGALLLLAPSAALAGDGAVAHAQGSASSNADGPLVQCVVSASAPTYTPGQIMPFSCDASGNVRVTGTGGGSGGGPVTCALCAVETGGNLAGAKADLDTLVADDGSVVFVSQSGAWSFTAASEAASGGAVPAKPSYVGVNIGGNLTGLQGCSLTAIYDASTSGETQIIALSGSTTTYICGYTISAAGTVNASLMYGTGTNCATSPTKMTPAWQLTAQVGVVDGSPFYRGLNAPAGKEVCFNASGAVAAQAIVYYDQH